MGDAGAGAEATSTSTPAPVHHFVLIHGIGGGSWCWYKIRCLLENSGHKVSCLDLKSAGIDTSDPSSVLSFDDYNKPLTDFMSTLNHKVILVGHSAGGLSVTQASRRFSHKIQVAIYVAATMLKFGFVTDQDLKDGVPDLSEFGDVYDFDFGQGADKPPTSALVKKQFQRQILYHMSPQEDSTLASMVVRPGPIQALVSARFTDEEGDHGDSSDEEEVVRVYIKTKQDRVVKAEQQEAMIKRWPPSHVYQVDSDHSPFFSTPFLLSGLLLKAASASCTPKIVHQSV